MANASPSWANVRPWRNNSPGDLRPLPNGELWSGQTSVDHAPGGPFVIFTSRMMGWRALALNLLAYQDKHNLRTVAQWCNRWAPPADHNDTSAYTALVARSMGVNPDKPQDLHDLKTIVAACAGIALAEGGARIVWDASERLGGVRLALAAAGDPVA